MGLSGSLPPLLPVTLPSAPLALLAPAALHGMRSGRGLLAAACAGRRAEVPVEGDRLGSKETPLTF